VFFPKTLSNFKQQYLENGTNIDIKGLIKQTYQTCENKLETCVVAFCQDIQCFCLST